MRYAGVALWLIAGTAAVVSGDITRSWIMAYVVFGIGFVASARWPRAALLSQAAATLSMWSVLPCHFGALLSVAVAWQLAAVLPLRVAALCIVAQTCLLGACIARLWHDETLIVAELLVLCGFQLAVAAAAILGRREREARLELLRVNGELLATRAVLELSTRRNERVRISRELHDVLGHDLTALQLQLEVASNVDRDHAGAHVERASSLAKRLLGDVRGVVAQLHAREHDDVESALRVLIADVPRLAIHLDYAADVVDPVRAHCLVRCVQELVTNTLRHSGASNLWIDIRMIDGDIAIDARDDGRKPSQAITWGNGLTGMRARIEELGGIFDVSTTTGFGIRATLPVGDAS